jgi:hypothetical protein
MLVPKPPRTRRPPAWAADAPAKIVVATTNSSLIRAPMAGEFPPPAPSLTEADASSLGDNPGKTLELK